MQFLNDSYFIVVDQFSEILVDLSHLHIQMDAGKPLIIFVYWNHSGDHAFEILEIFVSNGLISIDCCKDIVKVLDVNYLDRSASIILAGGSGE